MKAPGYEHDVDVPVKIVAPAHPITAGVSDFTINDEIYWNFRTTADITPLLRTTHQEMPNLILTDEQITDIVAYFRSLKTP